MSVIGCWCPLFAVLLVHWLLGLALTLTACHCRRWWTKRQMKYFLCFLSIADFFFFFLTWFCKHVARKTEVSNNSTSYDFISGTQGTLRNIWYFCLCSPPSKTTQEGVWRTKLYRSVFCDIQSAEGMGDLGGEGQGGGMLCSCQANVANALTFNHRLNPHINDTLFTRL